mmetsp:Transcript_10953/g.33763  ORF Transcript_10953/g.33763 Transcript_10953/m.33763 type:complete len:224 (-) Transcript_10953:701-1372(-)
MDPIPSGSGLADADALAVEGWSEVVCWAASMGAALAARRHAMHASADAGGGGGGKGPRAASTSRITSRLPPADKVCDQTWAMSMDQEAAVVASSPSETTPSTTPSRNPLTPPTTPPTMPPTKPLTNPISAAPLFTRGIMALSMGPPTRGTLIEALPERVTIARLTRTRTPDLPVWSRNPSTAPAIVPSTKADFPRVVIGSTVGAMKASIASERWSESELLGIE